MDTHSIASVSDILDTTVLPDPTIPVHFERFSTLKDSDDVLMHAAFWCYYAAWQLDKSGKSAPAGLAVEARHDGHTIRAITQELHVRDAVIITRRDLAVLKREALDNAYRLSGVLQWLWVAFAFAIGVLLALSIGGVLW